VIYTIIGKKSLIAFNMLFVD